MLGIQIAEPLQAEVQDSKGRWLRMLNPQATSETITAPLETLGQSQSQTAKLHLRPQNFRSPVPRTMARAPSCCSLCSSHLASSVTLPVFSPRLSIGNLQGQPGG